MFILKRFLIIFSCVAVLVSSLACVASADDFTVSGRWQWNETLEAWPGGSNGSTTVAYWRNLSLPFTSNDTSYIGLQFAGLDSDGNFSQFTYFYNTGQGNRAWENGGWIKEAYRTIDFGEGVTVSETFYNYLNDNAIWLDAPNPVEDLLSGITSFFSTFIALAGIVAGAMMDAPILSLFIILPILFIVVGLFVKTKNSVG